MLEIWGGLFRPPHFFMDLNLVRLIIPLNLQSLHAIMPLTCGKGAVFEEALRAACCLTDTPNCPDCLSSPSCSAPFLISRGLSNDPDLVRRHQKPGLPFVFKTIPQIKHESPQLGLTLLGAATSHLPMFLKALGRLSVKPVCDELVALDYQDTPISIKLSSPDFDLLPILAAADLLALHSHCFSCCKRIRIDLLTPLRLTRDGRELNRLEPVFFIRSLLRRISSLAAYYGGGVDQELFRMLSELAANVALLDFAPSQKATADFQRGVLGSFELSGPFDELGPYLALGSILHLGKGASFGMGSFAVTPLD